jgi:HEAT repeat protein
VKETKMPTAKPKPISFQQVISALLDSATPLPTTMLRQFSDISSENLAALKKIWNQVNVERRLELLTNLQDMVETDTLVSFDDLARFVLADENPGLRIKAIHLLSECEDYRLIPQFVRMMKTDTDEGVRSSAASALGMFVYLKELDKVTSSEAAHLEDHLLDAYHNDSSELVQRRALESLGFSCHPEVPPLVEKAYHHKDEAWIASALFAMGQSADSSWTHEVIPMLKHPSHKIQLEAVRAAGKLEIAAARQTLLEMLVRDEDMEEEMYRSIIWSLSEIGGKNVRKVLEALMDKAEDDDEVEFLDEALGNLEFTDGSEEFNLFDINADDDDEMLDLIVDLEEGEKDESDDEEYGRLFNDEEEEEEELFEDYDETN